MSYEDKITQIQMLVNSHNEHAEQKIDWDIFLKQLKEAGGTNEDVLKLCSFEDLEKFGLPRLLARQAANIFRKSDNKPNIVSIYKAKIMTAKEAFVHYDPRDADNAIGQRLQELSKGQRCVVFNNNGRINVEVSTKLIDEIRDNYPERDTYIMNGEPVIVYKIGERPDEMGDENPIYPGRLLRPDFGCDQTNRSWEGVSLAIRQLIYIAISDTHELCIGCIDDAHNVLDKCLEVNAEEKIRNRYTKASIRFRELEKQNKLPTLKIARKNKINSSFYGGVKNQRS